MFPKAKALLRCSDHSEKWQFHLLMSMFGVGKVYGPQLIAEVGDTRRFRNRRAITAFAGLCIAIMFSAV